MAVAYSAIVQRLLISCPGDIPRGDLTVVHQAINRWNGIYGEQFGAVVLPISWGEHAATEFGRPPQDVINEQLVDRCDCCVALFGNRMGTPTAVAESGTAEEIERLSNGLKYVGVLRSRRPIDPGTIDLAEAVRLEAYLKGIQRTSLVLEYADDAQLARHVDTMLSVVVSRDQALATNLLAKPRVAEVWPRLVRESNQWLIVLRNTGDAAAGEVTVAVDTKQWEIMADHRMPPRVESLAPGGEVRFLVIAGLSSPRTALCTISWKDDRGLQTNSASLRLV
ncbi:hypothetical protein AB0J74_24555 [Asanoa sp. NPDC049573]|uniref:hypothetical protein n=1 Tax=Asanoa sp. NPDC049573 TaxID=3155396 RepID=UPI00343E1D27